MESCKKCHNIRILRRDNLCIVCEYLTPVKCKKCEQIVYNIGDDEELCFRCRCLRCECGRIASRMNNKMCRSCYKALPPYNCPKCNKEIHGKDQTRLCWKCRLTKKCEFCGKSTNYADKVCRDCRFIILARKCKICEEKAILNNYKLCKKCNIKSFIAPCAKCSKVCELWSELCDDCRYPPCNRCGIEGRRCKCEPVLTN